MSNINNKKVSTTLSKSFSAPDLRQQAMQLSDLDNIKTNDNINNESLSSSAIDFNQFKGNDLSTQYVDTILDLYEKYIEKMDNFYFLEDINKYKFGGYHPLSIFDVLLDRYSAILKLGFGTFSTVWLCWDMREEKFVAIKILLSDKRTTKSGYEEIDILNEIQQRNLEDNVDLIQMFDYFMFTGINGTHICIVFEILGCSLLDLIFKTNKQGLPLAKVQKILKQILRDLHYLHQTCGIIHTDLKPENILLVGSQEMAKRLAFKAIYRVHHKLELPIDYTSNAPDSQLEAERLRLIKKYFQRKMEKVDLAVLKYNASKKTIDKKTVSSLAKTNVTIVETNCTNIDPNNSQSINIGTTKKKTLYRNEFALFYNEEYIKYYQDIGYPKYAVDILESAPEWIRDAIKDEEQQENNLASEIGDVQVKIGDFSNACMVDYHFSDQIQTRDYRSPEAILRSDYGPPVDIWSVACIAYELATGESLFNPRKTDSSTRDEDHLGQMIKLLGSFPKNVIESGQRKERFFDSEGRFLKGIYQDYDIYSLLVNNHQFSKPIANIFASFLESLLDYDPKTRPTALQCLQHDFIVQDLNNFSVFKIICNDSRIVYSFKERICPSPDGNCSTESPTDCLSDSDDEDTI